MFSKQGQGKNKQMFVVMENLLKKTRLGSIVQFSLNDLHSTIHAHRHTNHRDSKPMPNGRLSIILSMAGGTSTESCRETMSLKKDNILKSYIYFFLIYDHLSQ